MSAPARNLVLSGGPGHEFAATSAALAEVLDGAGVRSTVVDEPIAALDALGAPETTGGRPRFDLLTVHGLHWRMEAERYAHLRDTHAFALDDAGARRLAAAVDASTRLLAVHTAVICFDGHPMWADLCGAAWHWERSSHPPVGPVEVHVTEAGRRHPITAGLDDFTITDEAYGFLDEADDLEPLAVTHHGGRDHPLLWTRSRGDGRVVTSLLGHGPESLAHPAHRTILRRAAAWLLGDRAPDAPAPAERAATPTGGS